MRLITLLVILLLTGPPALAQVEAPPGCNTGAMGELFSVLAERLPSQAVSPGQAISIIDVLQDSLAALRSACAGETWSDPDAPDYDRLTQARAADGAFLLGDPAAPVTIVEFSDFLCPHCQNYHATIRRLIQAHVSTGAARLEVRMFPVVDAFASPLAASMVECADILEPGSFWRAQDLMYELTGAGFNGLTHFTFAARAGLDYDAMIACVNEDADQVVTDSELAQSAGVTGTPTIMVRHGDGELAFIEDDRGTRVASSVPWFVLERVILEANQP